MARSPRRTGRRHPMASAALIVLGLVVTGGAYAAVSTAASATATTSTAASQESIEAGQALFQSNCATCHGMNAEGTSIAPSLVGVGAASVDFQVGTGRMPMQATGPQAPAKPVQFTEEQIQQLADYVASLGPGPEIPSESLTSGGGDAANGAELFRINCAMCHNVAGAGGALTEGKYAPNLQAVTGQHIYEAMVVGPQNMPVFSDMNLSPEDKRDIITYLLYIQNNQSPGGLNLGDLGPVAEGLFAWIFGLGSLVLITIWITAKSN